MDEITFSREISYIYTLKMNEWGCMECRILFVDCGKSEQLTAVESLGNILFSDSVAVGTHILSNSLSEISDVFKSERYDIVISFSDTLKDLLELIPGLPATLHWVDRPSREILEDRIKNLINDGYLTAIVEQKKVLFSLLESLDDAVIAHDLDRRIVFFSRQAEKITGISREEAIGSDCHDLFPFVLCGGECSLCSKTEKEINSKQFNSILYDSEQQRKEMFVTVTPLKHIDDRTFGAMIVMKNVSVEKDLERKLGKEEQFHRLIGSDQTMLELYQMIRNIGTYDFPVLIQGESGSGKELVADAVHIESRRKGLFVPVNCGAIPEGTLESELFGHVKGSFTGAVRDKKGRFELADGGTIFLDEIGELPLTMQVKLLRVLQEGIVEPVGSEKPRKIDVRIVSATNKNLRTMIEEGTFREDLYYRLAVVPLETPSLKSRKTDVIILAKSFLKDICEKFDRQTLTLSRQTEALLLTYDWPGNVRQLLNAMQYAMIKSLDGVVEPYHLPPEIARTSFDSSNVVTDSASISDPIESTGEHVLGRRPVLNRESIVEALITTGGNKAKAARVLQVGRATLYNYLKKYPEILNDLPDA